MQNFLLCIADTKHLTSNTFPWVQSKEQETLETKKKKSESTTKVRFQRNP